MSDNENVYVLEITTPREPVDREQSVEAQRKQYAEYLDANAHAPFVADDPPLTFEQWLTWRLELAMHSLGEVYALLREYDTITQLEDEARAYDAEQNAGSDEYMADEWVRVLAVFEGARVLLDAESWDARFTQTGNTP